MKLATHCFAALFAAFTILPSASGIGNGPNYDPSKNMLFPGGSSSEALYSALNNAGEFGVSARSKKKGGKLKRIKDVELAVPGAQGLAHVSSVGAGSLVKTSATRLQEIMSMIPSSDGQSMKVFFRNKKGKVVGGKQEVSIAGQNWFETFQAMKNLEKQLKGAGAIKPTYPGSSAQRPQTRGAAPTDYVVLDNKVLSELKQIAVYHLKALVMVFEAYHAASDLFTFDEDSPINSILGGFSTIARSSVQKLLFAELAALQADIEQYISVDPDVVGLTLATLQDVIRTLLAGGPVDWDSLLEDVQELIDIPVKALTEDFVFVVEYTWPPEQTDLDTGTTFLGNTVGFDYSDTADYLEWTGDDVGNGGREEVRVDINAAAQASVLPASFQITCKAGWYQPSGGTGPATLHMYLLNRRTDIRYGEVTREIAPGTQNARAITPVGSASFTYATDTKVLTFKID